MLRFKALAVIARYEMLRAFARRKVLLLLILTLLFEAFPFLILTRLPRAVIPSGAEGLMWLVGILIPQSLFIHILAVLVSSGAMAEEYEQGTADILLSKPLAKSEYIAGKFVGGFILMALTAGLAVVLGVVFAHLSFGPQLYVEYAPLLYLSITLSTFTFYSMGFMLGEVLRKTTVTYLIGSTILVASLALGTYLFIAYSLTSDTFYLNFAKALPSWGTTNLPMILAREMFLRGPSTLSIFLGGLSPQGSSLEATGFIIIYTLTFVLISVLRFARSDISKRIS